MSPALMSTTRRCVSGYSGCVSDAPIQAISGVITTAEISAPATQTADWR